MSESGVGVGKEEGREEEKLPQVKTRGHKLPTDCRDHTTRLKGHHSGKHLQAVPWHVMDIYDSIDIDGMWLFITSYMKVWTCLPLFTLLFIRGLIVQLPGLLLLFYLLLRGKSKLRAGPNTMMMLMCKYTNV